MKLDDQAVDLKTARSERATAEVMGRMLKLCREAEGSSRTLVARLIDVSSLRHTETGGHLQRISRLSGFLARRLGLPHRQVERIETAAALHDIGKIGIEDAILDKPAPLSAVEWDLMKSHTTLGAQLLSRSTSSFLRLGRQIALSHHECWDGSGYPFGLRGEAIPLAARIVKICDQYDALRSARPYKPAYDHRHTLEILHGGDERTRPEHFDPRLLDLFHAIHPEVEAIWDTLAPTLDPPSQAALLSDRSRLAQTTH